MEKEVITGEDMLSTDAGKEELFMLTSRDKGDATGELKPGLEYPVPDFSTVIPPGRHLGYVYEWAIMAAATLLVALLLQFRPPRKESVT